MPPDPNSNKNDDNKNLISRISITPSHDGTFLTTSTSVSSSSASEIRLQQEENDDDSTSSRERPKSTVVGASINFVNCIIGAGCIGFGGAIAASGGMLSIVTMLFCAYLMKLSFDLLISLGLQTPCGIHSSYESLGETAYGKQGRLAVLISKGIFCFGGLIAIVVIVKDNFGPPMRHLILGHDDASSVDDNNESWLLSMLLDDKVSTFLLSAIVMLPLSMLRDMTPLERFSAVKIFSFLCILLIVVYLYFTTPTPPESTNGNFYTHWFQIRGGFIQNMGTYVFTFVAQHTCHLVYRSLKPELRNSHDWGMVTFLALGLSFLMALPIGLFPYMTFWENTTSNLFLLYPPSPAVDLARILLCFTMLLTYPPPFFSCRELIIISLPKSRQQQHKMMRTDDVEQVGADPVEGTPLLRGKAHLEIDFQEPSPYLLPGEDRQLKLKYHVLLTLLLWGVTVILALYAPSLGDVLNLVGCATGTIIAFILPAMFAFRIEGYSRTAALLIVVGGVVGCIGTYFSLVDLINDL